MAKKAKKVSNKNRDVVSDGNFATASDGLSGNRVFVSCAKTINLGNYESLRVEFGFGRTVPDGEKFADVLNECKVESMRSLNEMVAIVESSTK